MTATAQSLPPQACEVHDEVSGVVASATRITGWAEIARPGDEFVYATRCYLPPAAEGARAARTLYAQGFVHLKQRRLAGGLTNYIAERSSRPWGAGCVARRDGPALPLSGEAAAIDVLLPLLKRYARFGRPCPTDAQLAERAGLATEVVQPALAAMASAGMIRIKGVKAPTLRIIAIVDTGHVTGMIG